jgi:para-aminobenzoate synthetase component II
MQKILLIDNNDSFTYNIVDYLRRIGHVDLQVIKSSELIISQIELFDKIMISPGPGLPKDFPHLFEVFDQYLRSKPILGICLGHQALAEYFGGSLKQLDPVIHGQAHAVKVLKYDKIFEDIPDTFQVGLYHSWAVDESQLPSELELLAISEKNIIMGLKHKKYPVYGVQFHPESYITDHGFTLLKNFIEISC